MAEVKAKVTEALGLPPSEYTLIQVERLRTGFCQLVNTFAHYKDEALTVKEAKIPHLSTWIIVRDPVLRQVLLSFTNEDVKPITLKIRHFGKEDAFQVYSNLTMEDLLTQIGYLTEQDPKAISVKVVEDTVIRRVDRQILNKDNPTLKNKLSCLKIVDNSALLIEMKDSDEIEAGEDEVKL